MPSTVWTQGQRKSSPARLPCAPRGGPGTHIQGWLWGLPCPRHWGPHHACGSTEGQLADRARARWAQGLPGRWGRGRVVQLGPWGASEVGGVQPRWPRVVGWVQVTCWCHLAWEAGADFSGVREETIS